MNRTSLEKLLREFVGALGVSPPGTDGNSGSTPGTISGTESGTEPEGAPVTEEPVQEFAAVGGGAVQGLTAPLGADPKTPKNLGKNRIKKSSK